jgi:hypothetical protein
MAITRYEATFSNGVTVTREYARPLAYAWHVEYANAKDESQTATKHGFSATREAAEKATKLPKRCKVLKADIVEAKAVGTVATKAKATKPKAVKPCKAGEEITLRLGGAEITGTVAKVGRAYAYVNVTGALAPVKVAFAAIVTTSPEPLPLAQAA